MKDIKQIKSMLGLKNVDYEITDIMALIFSNSMLAGEIPDGYYMARQKFNVYDDKRLVKDRLDYTTAILKKKKMNHNEYVSCKSEVIFDQKTYAELFTYLIKKNTPMEQSMDHEYFLQSRKLKRLTRFLPEQIEEFSRWSGDPNRIHCGNNPIVQGMLLFLTVEDYLQSNTIKMNKGDMKYLNPVRTHEDIFIIHEKNTITGISKDKKCFVLQYEEDKDV